jgi:hypothetical protein
VTHANVRSEPDGTVARFYEKLRRERGEGTAEGYSGRIREDAQDDLLGPEGEEAVRAG